MVETLIFEFSTSKLVSVPIFRRIRSPEPCFFGAIATVARDASPLHNGSSKLLFLKSSYHIWSLDRFSPKSKHFEKFREKWQRLENFSPEIPKNGQNQKRTRYSHESTKNKILIFFFDISLIMHDHAVHRNS